jgi:heat shock protein HslJ
MSRRLWLTVVVTIGIGWAGPTPAGGASWLDAPTPKAWNKPGAKIPRAPRFDPDPFLARQCANQTRAPATDADRAVAAAGWKLFGASQRFGTTEVLLGRSGVDGMCRPLGYQVFVFSGDRFAGTLAPRPMDSRSDGAAQLPQLVAAGTLTAPFSRYSSRDPLCCPSRLSTVEYRLADTPKGPVLVAGSVNTVTTAEPAPAAPPAPVRSQPGIAGRPWQLVRIRMMDGAVLVPDAPDRYTLELGADGRASVQADCNRGSGTFQLEGASLTFGPVATTRAMCPPGSLSDRYLAQLGLVATWTEKDGMLHLATGADGAILDFQPADQLR